MNIFILTMRPQKTKNPKKKIIHSPQPTPPPTHPKPKSIPKKINTHTHPSKHPPLLNPAQPSSDSILILMNGHAGGIEPLVFNETPKRPFYGH